MKPRSLPIDVCKLVRTIAREDDIRPSDLRPGEQYEIDTRLDEASDGLRISAHRCFGYGADAFYKSDDTVIPGKLLRLGNRELLDAVYRELEFLASRLKLAARPPKGWRLFGRRSMTVGPSHAFLPSPAVEEPD